MKNKDELLSKLSLLDNTVSKMSADTLGMPSAYERSILGKAGIQTVEDLFTAYDEHMDRSDDWLGRVLEHMKKPAEMWLPHYLATECEERGCAELIEELTDAFREELNWRIIDKEHGYVCVVRKDGNVTVYAVTCTYMPVEIFSCPDGSDAWLTVRAAAGFCKLPEAHGEASYRSFLRMVG